MNLPKAIGTRRIANCSARQSATAPEENERTAEVVEEWNMVAGRYRASRAARRIDEDKNLGEQLVDDGLEEATHDQMLEARKEERSKKANVESRALRGRDVIAASRRAAGENETRVAI